MIPPSPERSLAHERNPSHASTKHSNPHRVIGAVVATGIMSFCGVIVETAMYITFPALMSYFGIGTSSVQWMTTLYLLVVASITPLSAALKR